MAAECILQDVRIGSEYIGMVAAKDAFDRGASTSEIVATAWTMANLSEPDRDAELTSRRLSHFILDCAAHALDHLGPSVEVAAAVRTIETARELADTPSPGGDLEVLDCDLKLWAYRARFDAAWSTASTILTNCFDGADQLDCRDPMVLAQKCAAFGRERAEVAWQDQRLIYWLLSADPQPSPLAKQMFSASAA